MTITACHVTTYRLGLAANINIMHMQNLEIARTLKRKVCKVLWRIKMKDLEPMINHRITKGGNQMLITKFRTNHNDISI